MESAPNENCTEQSLQSKHHSLASIHRSWGFPTDNEILWLLDRAVSDQALWPISGATVRFESATFDLDHEGERALTFRAEDRGKVRDLIAWQPRTGALASWRGQAFCLGDADDSRIPRRPTIRPGFKSCLRGLGSKL
jgi:hypothetical protein